jgi:hypothetical protein
VLCLKNIKRLDLIACKELKAREEIEELKKSFFYIFLNINFGFFYFFLLILIWN